MSKTKNNTLRKDSIENRYKTYYGFNTLIIQQFQYSNTLYPIENGFSEKTPSVKSRRSFIINTLCLCRPKDSYNEGIVCVLSKYS